MHLNVVDLMWSPWGGCIPATVLKEIFSNPPKTEVVNYRDWTVQDRWQFSPLGEEKAGLNCISHGNQDEFSYWGPGLLEWCLCLSGGVGRGLGSPRSFMGMWVPGSAYALCRVRKEGLLCSSRHWQSVNECWPHGPVGFGACRPEYRSWPLQIVILSE